MTETIKIRATVNGAMAHARELAGKRANRETFKPSDEDDLRRYIEQLVLEARSTPVSTALEILKETRNMLDVYDSEIDTFEDDEEEAEAVPVQYAMRRISMAIDELEPQK